MGGKDGKDGYPSAEGMNVHSRTIASADERNLGSREARRVKAKDPKKLPPMTLKEVEKLSEKEG